MLAASAAALGFTSAAAGLAWLVDRRAEDRERRALALAPPEGRLVEVAGRRVHAVTCGRGPDVILIHGASGNARDFTFDLVGRLAARYRVTAFDRPGMGYSERARDGLDGVVGTLAETPREQAELLSAAARILGITRPVVVGHSYGGAVALAWGLAQPAEIAALVVLAGVAMPWDGRIGWLYRVNGSPVGGAVVAPIVSAFATPARVTLAVTSTFAPDPVPPGYAEHLGTGLTLRRGALRTNARQVRILLPSIRDMAARYATLPMPVEVVHGDADRTTPFEHHAVPLARLAPRARLTRLEGVGHMPHHVRPDAVVAAIDRAAGAAS